MSCSPLGFLPGACAASPSTASPSGFCTLFRVRQHVWLQLAGLLLGLSWRVLCCATWFSPMCRALPQGLQLALFSLLQVPLGFSGHRVSVLLLPWCRGLGLALPFFLGFSCSTCLLGWLGFCTLCQGAPIAMVSAWVDGAVTLLPFPYSLTLGWVCFWPTVSPAQGITLGPVLYSCTLECM